jgi:hypothetical protein
VSSSERLEDYLFGSMDEGEAARFEEAMFDDPEAPAQVASLLALLDTARSLHAAETTLGMTTSAAAIAAFEARGGRTQRYEAREGAPVRAPVDAGADLLIGRLELDLRGVERVDLELLDVDGTSRGAHAMDVEVDREQGCVWVPCAPEVAIASEATLFRVHAHRDDGSITRHDFVGIVDGVAQSES